MFSHTSASLIRRQLFLAIFCAAAQLPVFAQAIVFSDEFNNDQSLSHWSLRHILEGTPAQYTVLDSHQTTPGHLTIVPVQTPGWFSDGDAPLIFKSLSGSFSVHTRVTTRGIDNPAGAPTATFNSAGLMARDAGGIIAGAENHIMVNVGRQSSATGSETKTTINSTSQLLLEGGDHSGELVLCRVGETFHAFRRLDGDADWVELQSYVRPDLPSELQVGMVVNAFGGADIQAEFDFIRALDTPSTAAECLPPVASQTDGDSIPDRFDNCMLLPNEAQRDTDGDGLGNACDADFNQDCVVNFVDLGLLRLAFFGDNPNYDLDNDGAVNFVDLGFLRLSFFDPPGPSGLADCH